MHIQSLHLELNLQYLSLEEPGALFTLFQFHLYIIYVQKQV